MSVGVSLPLPQALTGKFFKHGRSAWRPLDDPGLESSLADTHAHVQLLPHPALALARAGAHDVHFLGLVTDVVEDDLGFLDELATWEMAAAMLVRRMGAGRVCGAPAPHPPKVRLIAGCHPHNAKDWDAAARERLRAVLRDGRATALGEVGLDYHYDFSPRESQRAVFAEQIQMAHELGIPLVLHVREAHDEALAILDAEGWPAAGVLLHCCTLGPAQLAPWLERGAFVAFGGALTFGSTDEVREAAALVPEDRLLTETDAPYMAPKPLRGQTCEPAMVALVAERLCAVRGVGVGLPRRALLERLMANARGLLDRPALSWQDRPAARGDLSRAQEIVSAYRLVDSD